MVKSSVLTTLLEVASHDAYIVENAIRADGITQRPYLNFKMEGRQAIDWSIGDPGMTLDFSMLVCTCLFTLYLGMTVEYVMKRSLGVVLHVRLVCIGREASHTILIDLGHIFSVLLAMLPSVSIRTGTAIRISHLSPPKMHVSGQICLCLIALAVTYQKMYGLLGLFVDTYELF